jgi:hypothetical protein
LERELLDETETALGAMNRQEADESHQSLDTIEHTITDIKSELERCGTDVCKTVRVHADSSHPKVKSARTAVSSGNWTAATAALKEVRTIVEGDIDLLIADLGSDGDGHSSVDDALYDYLEGTAVIGERCVLTLPDTEIRRSDNSLAVAMTPERLLEYMTDIPERTESATDNGLYAWGRNQPHFAAELTVPDRERYDPWLQLVALGYNGENNNATIALPPYLSPSGSDSGGDNDIADEETQGPENWLFTSNGDVNRFSGRDLNEWGEEQTVGDIAVSKMIIGSVQAQPEDCPSPMPALFHLRRIRHDDQCLYVCGWTIDDGALYDNSLTMLMAKDVNELVQVEYDEVDAMRRAIEGGLVRERSKLGSMVYDGEFGAPVVVSAQKAPLGSKP